MYTKGIKYIRYMTNKTKWIIGIVVVALVIIGLVQANKKDDGKSSSMTDTTTQTKPTGPIKIGVLGPYSGDAASYGELLRNVAQVAIDEINSNGGINGQQVEGVFEDGKCNGKDAASAMQKLVNVDKVQVVVGGFCSGESIAATPVAAQAKVALLSPGSSSPDLTNISKYFSRDYPSDASQGAVLAEAAHNAKSYKKVAILQEQTPYAQGLFKVFNDKFTGAGGSVVKEEFPSNTTDFRSQLTKLRGANPDALFVDSQTAAVAARILKQLADMNWKPQLILNEATAGDAATLSDNKVVLEGALTAEFGVDVNNTKYQHMLTLYKNKFGKDPNFLSYSHTTYDAIYIFKDAITAVGYDGDKIADYLHNLKDWQGASGSITIGSDGDRASGYHLETVQGGKTVVQ